MSCWVSGVLFSSVPKQRVLLYLFTLAMFAKHVAQRTALLRRIRPMHTTAIHRNTPTALSNMLSSGPAPPVQVKRISPAGIELVDGLILPSACIFLEGNVFLWDVPPALSSDWSTDKFQLFEVVVPKPGRRVLTSRRTRASYYSPRDTLVRDWKRRRSPATVHTHIFE